MFEHENPGVPTSEQQLAQHAASMFITKSLDIMLKLLVKAEQNQKKEDDFGKIATIIFKLNYKIAQEADKNRSLQNLYFPIGSKEQNQKDIAFLTIVRELCLDYEAQEIVVEKEMSIISPLVITNIITPSVIPNLFILQTQKANGNSVNKQQNFYLVGKERLPKGYQPPLYNTATFEHENPGVPTSEQQLAQPTVSIFISKSLDIILKLLVKAEQNQKKEDDFKDIVKLIFQLKYKITNKINLDQSLRNLHFSIGSKENHQTNVALTIIIESLSADSKPQKITIGREMVTVTHSVIPNLFILKIQKAVNGSPMCKQQNFYLVGSKMLPKEFQYLSDYGD